MESFKALMKAGHIASQVRENVQKIVKVGIPVIDICNYVEGKILDLGGAPAFPCNVDINHVAAHYTSAFRDKTTVPEASLVKVDIGVQVDGYIADTAITSCLSPQFEPMVEAAEAGLEAAIKMVRAGAVSVEIGAAIERAIKSRGYAPIRNLTGHKMSRYLVHAGQSIPNVPEGRRYKLQTGEVYAIEPFAVVPNAAGLVVDGPPSNIFIFKKRRKVKSQIARKMLKFIQSNFRTMPFASRWVLNQFKEVEGLESFNELLYSKCIYSYPQLVERSKAMVAQAEHTVIVKKNGCEITTA
jgi:methionyl aminopeptidase